MAALKYKEEHNKVGYLLKPIESDDYHQIIDFLSESHIRYALTSNLIIFDSLVKQFWSTATLRESELGRPAILATIDKTPYTITKTLVRSRLQLADDGCVIDLPIPEIYSGMDNIGYVTEGKLTFFKNKFSPHSAQPKTDAGSFPTMKDAPLGGNFHTSPPRSSHAPPAGQPLGGEEDPITLTALSSIVSTLVHKVHSLEAELHDHKKLFKDVIGKLVKMVKSLEVKLKTKKRKLVVSDSDPEDSTTQDMDLDALRALANVVVAADSDIPSGNTSQVPAVSSCAPTTGPSVVPGDSTKVPTDSPNVPAGVSSKGKSPMVKEDVPVTARSFR
nr:hypothetical protein [Tanacetum cinerariifolium]